MLPEIGLFSLILALMFALLLVVLPTIGLYRPQVVWRQSVSFYVYAQSFCLWISFLCLVISFLRDDFSVVYILLNSSRSLPWFYKACAVWGGHEGSMLLWVVILSLWMCAVARFSHVLTEAFRTRVLVILGLLSIGFILFLLTTSNPFLRQFQTLDTLGRDLNPLLQDPGFLFHPPLLYMGYVGFSVAFAFAMAALWMGHIEAAWARWTRPWTLAAWCCLTAGITLGSWWAYRELGWGGWWFWDPVENASFMPWLVGTALLHALMICEKRQQWIGWTLLLALSGFSLSLVGTFLVRSGVLTSVHAFAVDPTRGLYILVFLGLVIGGALTVFACRSRLLTQTASLALWSRESVLLLNNLFLMVAMFTVLLGTTYPLLIDGLGLGKLSVGAPYFNTVFIPLMLPLVILTGIGVHVKWQQDNPRSQWIILRWVALMSFMSAVLAASLTLQTWPIWGYMGLVAGVFLIGGTLMALMGRLKKRRAMSPSFIGMILAHFGLGMTVIGIAVSTSNGIEADVKMKPADHMVLAGVQLTFVQANALQGPNYHGTQAVFQVTQGQHHATIYPEKRIYDVAHMVMTDAAIDVSPFRDVYVALGEPLEATSWSVRLYYKPFIRWIWAGGFLMVLGGGIALMHPRYYQRAMIV